jgi:hypothetical protein
MQLCVVQLETNWLWSSSHVATTQLTGVPAPELAAALQFTVAPTGSGKLQPGPLQVVDPEPEVPGGIPPAPPWPAVPSTMTLPPQAPVEPTRSPPATAKRQSVAERMKARRVRALGLRGNGAKPARPGYRAAQSRTRLNG